MQLTGATGSKVLLFSLVFLAALVVANLAFNVQSLSTPVGPRGGLEFGQSESAGRGLGLDVQLLATGIWVVALVAALFVVVLYLKYGPKKGKIPFLEFIPLIVGFAVLMTIAYLGPGEVLDPVEEEESEEGEVVPGEGQAEEPGAESEGSLGLTPLPFAGLRSLVGWLALLFIGLWAAMMVFRSIRRLGPTPLMMSAPEEVREGAVQSLERGIYRLHLGDDIRSVILRCYRDLVGLYRQRGLPLSPGLTAREVEKSALEFLGLSPRSSRSLRSLFEVARYSDHPLSDEDRHAAISSLEGVRGEVEA